MDRNNRVRGTPSIETTTLKGRTLRKGLWYVKTSMMRRTLTTTMLLSPGRVHFQIVMMKHLFILIMKFCSVICFGLKSKLIQYSIITRLIRNAMTIQIILGIKSLDYQVGLGLEVSDLDLDNS